MNPEQVAALASQIRGGKRIFVNGADLVSVLYSADDPALAAKELRAAMI